jgi:tRNA1(Val) A37 N6-methylase TrmN6
MDVTEDRILGARLVLRQSAHGYRVNADTVLLSAAVAAEPGASLMEAGCGVGAASLAVAQRVAGVRVLGVERDPAMAALARENVIANGLGEQVSVELGDALARSWGVFDGVFCNPPFDLEGEGRAPAEARRSAHIAEETIDAWIAALSDRLKGGAALTLIHRASKLSEILAALEGRLGGVDIFPIRPFADEPAKRVIIRARKGSRAPLRLLKGLDLHDRSGAKHTPEAEAILRGDALIGWG